MLFRRFTFLNFKVHELFFFINFTLIFIFFSCIVTKEGGDTHFLLFEMYYDFFVCDQSITSFAKAPES